MSGIGTLITTGQFETTQALELAITGEAWGAETGTALLELGTVMVSAHADGTAVDAFFAQIQEYQKARHNGDAQTQRQLLEKLARGISRYYAQIRPHLAFRNLGARRFGDPRQIRDIFLPHPNAPAHSARVDTNGARAIDGAMFMMGGAAGNPVPPPPRRVRPEELNRQMAEARALYATFENLVSEIPSGGSLAIARRLVADLEPQLRRESLETVQAVQESYLQLLSLKLDEVFKATVDPKWVEPFALEIEPKVTELLRDPHRGSIPEEVLRSLVQTYIRYWFGHFRGVNPPALTFFSEVLYAAAHRVWRESVSRFNLPPEAEGIFYREATLLIYSLVTWEAHRVVPLTAGSTETGYLSYADLVQKMGEHHAILEMLYGNMVGEGKIQAANGMMELVYKYVRLLSQRVGSKLNEQYLKEHGLEADLVRLLLVRAFNLSAYTDEALESLRYFFETITGRESPSLQELKDLPTLKPSAKSPLVAQTIAYVPFEKGWTLADLIDHLSFRLGETVTRADFEARVGLTYNTVRQWGKRKELGVAETPLDQDVAVEPEEHKKMWAVYLELDRMCQRYGVRLDFWDYLASIFPTVSEMRELAQKTEDGQNEIVVRAPNIVKGTGFEFLNYGSFSAALRRFGFHGLLGEDVERPRWMTLARIAEYISNKAGGDETHQKEIYNFLVMLRLIDVMPMATDIRDVSGTILSHKDPSTVSRHRLRIYPEDPKFQYSPGEESGTELVSARHWPVSDVQSGKFDTKLEILEARAGVIETFLGLDYPLVTASGEPVTVSALKEKLQELRRQHALYKGDLNDRSHDSPLRHEKAKEYLADLRKFYRGVDRLFHEWHLLIHARGSLQAGSLTIPYVIAPSVRGVTKSAQMENGFVVVVVDDIRGLSNQQMLFRLRIVMAKLRQEGVLAEKDLKDGERIFAEVSPYFSEPQALVMQAVQENMRLTENLAAQQLPATEAGLVQLLVTKTPPIGNGREPYYLYVPLWENDLRRFYNETGRKAFAEKDIEVAEDYFLAVRHPHYIYNGGRLMEIARKIYPGDGEANQALDRLEKFFTLIGVKTNAVAPNGAVAGDIKIGELSELVLRSYIDAFPSARGLNVPVPVVEAVLLEVVDRLLVQHPEARGHRTVLIGNLRRAVAEYNQAGDRASFTKLEETYSPLPQDGMLSERLQPYAFDVTLRRAYFNLLTQLRHGTKPTREDCVRALENVIPAEAGIQTLSRLEAFVDHQWETMGRFRNMMEDSTIGVGNYVERKYGPNGNLIDRAALTRLVLFYLNNRILGFLPVALDEAIIDEVSRHFAPLQEVRELAIRSYRILLNNYLRELGHNLREGDELILMSLDAVAQRSKAATKDDFLREVAKDLQMTPELVAEGAKDYEALAPLLGQQVTRHFMPEAVDAGYALVQGRLEKEEADKKEKIQKEVRELEQRWEKSRTEMEAILVLPISVVPAFTPVDVSEWRGSQTRRDDYNRVLKRRGTDFDTTVKTLDAAEKKLAEAKSAHAVLKRTTTSLAPLLVSLALATNAEAVTKATDEMGQRLEQRTVELVAARTSLVERRERVIADLAAMHESFKADAQAQPLLATASKTLDVLKRQRILQKEINDSGEELARQYEAIVTAAEALSPTFENIAEMGARRSVFVQPCKEKKALFDVKTESFIRERDGLPETDETMTKLRELAERSVTHRDALFGASRSLEEERRNFLAESGDEKLRRSVELQLAINGFRKRFETWISNVVPRPFRAIPDMPEIPSTPYLVKNGTRQVFGMRPFDAAPLQGKLFMKRPDNEKEIDTILTNHPFLFTAQGTFLIINPDRINHWVSTEDKNPLKVRDILGEEIVLNADDIVVLQKGPEQFAAWIAAKKEKPAQNIYVRFLENFRLLTKDGADDVYTTVMLLMEYGASSNALPLWRELAQILSAYDTAGGVKPLEELIRSWTFGNYERILATSMGRILEPLMVVDKPFMAVHPLAKGELEGITPPPSSEGDGVTVGGERKSLKDFLRDANWLVADIDEKRWREINEKIWRGVAGVLMDLSDPKASDSDTWGKALYSGLPAIFPQVFRHLFSISPHLYEEVIMVATGLAVEEKQKSPSKELTVRLEKSLEVAFHYFDREVLYHDVFYHYRPWDWSEPYLEASYMLYGMMPEVPDLYGFRVVGWRDFEGKNFMVSPEEREKILKGERTLHVFGRDPDTSVAIHLPEKLTPDQLRWVPPYSQTDPEIWKAVKTFYLDPTMTVCASIYEEAYAMATRQINPDPALLQMIGVIVSKGTADKSLVRKSMVTAYRSVIFQQQDENVDKFKKAIANIQQSRFVIPMPPSGASIGKWNQFVRERKGWLAKNHTLGYDRQLDEGYEGVYKASVREAASLDDRLSVLSGWVNFLSESIRLADIVGMLQVELEWGNSYADRYLAVSRELERLYVEAGRRTDVDQLIEDRSNLFRQKLVSAMGQAGVTSGTFRSWPLLQSEVASDEGERILERRAEAVAKTLPAVFEPEPSPRNERAYQIMLATVFGSTAGATWRELQKYPEFKRVASLNTPRKFEAFYTKVCDRYLALRRMPVYQTENPLVLWLVAIRQIFGGTLPAREKVVEASRVALLAQLYQKSQEFVLIEDLILRDFPDLSIGRLRYTERPPTTSITP